MPEDADPAVLAQLASATLHTIAIRARAQVPRKELEAIVKGAIDVMVGKTMIGGVVPLSPAPIARRLQYPLLRSTTFSSAPPASKRAIWSAT